MARVKCYLCDGMVDTTKGNYQFVNGLHSHKKCAKKSTLSDEEKIDLRKLTDAVKWVSEQQNIFLSPAQWRLITNQIKNLKEQGYSYQDQLKAFKWYFDKGNEYKGYGIVEWIIEQALNEDTVVENESNSQDIMKQKMEQLRRERLERS